MSLLSYNNFINEKFLFENLREMKFVLSKRMIDLLNSIDHPISHELLKLHSDLDFDAKQTFIDVHKKKDDVVTFIQANKAADLLKLQDKETYDKFDKSILLDLNITHDVYKKHRGETRIGRFINNIFGAAKFAAELENFVRMFKAKHGQEEKFKLMEVVQGDDISYYYNCERYYNRSGSLGSSCMADVSASYFLIYEYNSNVGMLVLYSDESKEAIKGRAIVWMNLVEPQGRTFMDRIYTNNSADEQLFIEYAIQHNWLYKSQQSIGENIQVIDPNDNSKRSMKILAQLNEGDDFDYYPYMDTMVYFNPETGKISNRKMGMTLFLQSTYGNAEDLYGYDDSTVFSNYHNEDIYESEAKWCEFGEDWVIESEAIKVFNSGGQYAVPGHPDIVHSYIPNIVNKHFEKSKCKWSDYLGTWIFYSSIRYVWMDKEKTESVIDYKKREDIKFAKIGDDYFHIDLVEKDGDEWKFIE